MSEAATTQLGDTLDRSFEVLRCAGRGAAGTVYHARDRDLGREVALKILDGKRAQLADLERFQREARILASHPHPAIVEIYDLDLERVPPYLVLAWMSGGDLKGLLRREGTLPPERVAGIGARMASALAHLHSHRILHRDLKPQNVLLDGRGEPHLADLGLARVEEGSDLTGTGMIVGTPRYMAPEVVQEGIYSPQSDLYALGVLLIELLLGADALDSGILPAEGLQDRIEHAGLRRILGRCLARDPVERYPDGERLRRRLEEITRGRTTVVGGVAPRSEARSERPLLLGAALVLGGLAVLATLSGRSTEPPPVPVSVTDPAELWRESERGARRALHEMAVQFQNQVVFGSPEVQELGRIEDSHRALQAFVPRALDPTVPLRLKRLLRSIYDWLELLEARPEGASLPEKTGEFLEDCAAVPVRTLILSLRKTPELLGRFAAREDGGELGLGLGPHLVAVQARFEELWEIFEEESRVRRLERKGAPGYPTLLFEGRAGMNLRPSGLDRLYEILLTRLRQKPEDPLRAWTTFTLLEVMAEDIRRARTDSNELDCPQLLETFAWLESSGHIRRVSKGRLANMHSMLFEDLVRAAPRCKGRDRERLLAMADEWLVTRTPLSARTVRACVKKIGWWKEGGRPPPEIRALLDRIRAAQAP